MKWWPYRCLTRSSAISWAMNLSMPLASSLLSNPVSVGDPYEVNTISAPSPVRSMIAFIVSAHFLRMIRTAGSC